MTLKIKLLLNLATAFLLVFGIPPATGFAQQANKEFSLGITNSSSSIVQLSTTTLKAMEELGFVFPPSFDYLSRNFSTKFDFNKDGFKDIIWVVPKNPSIGSPLLVFLWNQEQKKFIEDPKFFVLGHGDHMFYYDTVDDFDGDGDLDVYLPVENYHGQNGMQPDYYFEGDYYMPGNLLINKGDSFERKYIDTTTVDHGNRKGYPSYSAASLLQYDEDNKLDLIVPSINQNQYNRGFLATKYTVDSNGNVSSTFVFPWESNEMYKGQTHSMQFKNFGDKIYAFLQTKEDYPDGVTTQYYYTYPEVWVYKKAKIGEQPELLKKIELKRNKAILDQGQILNHDTFYIADLDKDGSEEIIIGMFSLPLSDKHFSVHVFDNQGKEVTDTWFKNEEFLDRTGTAANGFSFLDLNGDGFMDILFRDHFNSKNGEISMLMNTGKKFEQHILMTESDQAFNVPVDTDKDGSYEILKVSNKIPDLGSFVKTYKIDYTFDGIAPQIKINNNLKVSLDQTGKATLTIDQVNNGSTDNVGITSMTLSKTYFTCTDLGTNKVTFTAKDAKGNTSTAEVTITVVDEIKATLKAKASYTIKLDVQGRATLKWEDIDEGSSDNCSIKDRKLSKSEFSRTDGGDNKVTYTLTDISGNTSSIDLTVRVDIVLSTPERPIESNTLKAYPNPADSYINLEFVEGISYGSIRTSSLVDASGKVLGELTLEDTGNGRLGFSTRDLKNGMYFLRLGTRDTLHLIKFTVIH
jgi:hypothetical protein